MESIFSSMSQNTIIIISASIFLIGIILEINVYPKLGKRFAREQKRDLRYAVKVLQRITLLWILLLSTSILINNIILWDLDTELINRIYLIIFIISIGYSLDRYFNLYITLNKRKGKLPPNSILTNLIRILIITIIIGITLGVFTISLTPIIGALGIGALAIALALQDTLANFFAGIYIIMSKQINQNDYIRLNTGEEGFLTNINWRSATLLSLKNNIHVIPNKVIASVNIINYSLYNNEITLKVPIGVSYDSDLEFVEKITMKILIKAQKELDDIFNEFVPLVRFLEFGDSSINLEIHIRVNSFIAHIHVRHELIKRLSAGYKKAGINIPFPQRTLHFANNMDNELLE